MRADGTDRETLIQRLSEAATKVEGVPLPSEIADVEGVPSPDVYEEEFGSWGAAVDAAGIETPMQEQKPSYDRSKLLELLADAADELGHAPTVSEFNDLEGYPSGATYTYHFGTWLDALETAGLDPDRSPKRYDREELIGALQDAADELGRSPLRSEIDDSDDYPSGNTYTNGFGSWADALDAAGIDIPEESHYNRGPYNRDELLEKLREAADDLGHPPTVDEVNDLEEYPSSTVYDIVFESWTDALSATGMEIPPERRGYEQEELLELLQNAADELGHRPSLREMNDLDEYPSGATYQYRFGSWGEALEAAGFDAPPTSASADPWKSTYHVLRDASPDDVETSTIDGPSGVTSTSTSPTWQDEHEHSDSDELLDRLRDASEELGYPPFPDEMDELDGYPSAWAYYDEFQRWEEVLEAAGIDVPEVGHHTQNTLPRSLSSYSRRPLISSVGPPHQPKWRLSMISRR